ncbi:MAG: FAD-dependent oxidoreductase [Clostridia bacterium]|nr:FAD-dependent oxidoreductase [Clostridia bacterium]
MYKVVIIGAGWAGCAAAVTAKKAGAEVTLLERTDMILGLGNVGGIMRNNGRFTAAEENIQLGAGDLFQITDKLSRHINIDFPGHKHASLYDVSKIEAYVKKYLKEMGINIVTLARVVDVEKEGNSISSVILSDDTKVNGDAFVECTGSTGPMGNCLEYGKGCCMCILRCPSFGPRISVSRKCGIDDIMGQRKDGSYGAFSGSCKLEKGSLSDTIVQELNEKGVAILPLKKEDVNEGKLDIKVCQQYALKAYAENIILLDTGHAKLMTPFFPLDKLREVEGLEYAKYIDPYSGGKGNSIRYLSIAPRDDFMRIRGVNNLFCAGEKSGLFVGHTEAIITGSLAGHNSVRYLKGIRQLNLPIQLAVGDLIAYANENIHDKSGLMTRYTFAGAEYFERMKVKNLYSIDPDEIEKRVNRFDLKNIYNEKII